MNSAHQFRSGARSIANCLGVIVTFLSMAGCAPDRAAHTVDEYKADASLRGQVLSHCESDPGSLKNVADCVNAQEAQRSLGIGNLRDLSPLKLPGKAP